MAAMAAVTFSSPQSISRAACIQNKTAKSSIYSVRSKSLSGTNFARVGAASRAVVPVLWRATECAGGARDSNGATAITAANAERTITRLAIPSKGRMAEDTQELLRSCQLKVNKTNPRQYTARVTQLPGMEVWFQRASDVVRRMRAGDVDLGILGMDMFEEFGEGDDELVVIHEALSFGHCHLSLGVPTGGEWEHIRTLDDLMAMKKFTKERPLRVVTGYQYIAKQFFKKIGFANVQLLTADGALEAAPKMDYADIILDLVSTGTTLRENNLKELEGGVIMQSEGVLVARRQALLDQPEALSIVRLMLERIEAHLKAEEQFTVVTNMRGKSQEDVAKKLMDADPLLCGLQGPTVGRVFTRAADGSVHDGEFYGVTICVPQNRLYESVALLRQIGGSGIMVSPLTYIFDEQPERWGALLQKLGIEDYDSFVPALSK